MSAELHYAVLGSSDDDLKKYAELINTEYDVPWSVDDLRLQETSLPAGSFSERRLIELGGKAIGTDLLYGRQGKAARFELALLPEYRQCGFETEIYSQAIERSLAKGATSMKTWVRSDRSERIAALNEAKFKKTMRTPVYDLDLLEFCSRQYDSIVQKVKDAGIRLVSIAEIHAQGIDWVPMLRDLHFECMQDVPQSESPVKPSLEDWRQWVDSGLVRFLEGWVVAASGDRWIGLTSLQPELGKPEMAMAGLTGVIRTYRRQGIALALKVAALEQAKKAGVQFVRTENEENNAPILELNKRLGFREVYAMELFEKRPL